MRFILSRIKKPDNKGATIVTVLVAVSFLMIMGSILLFTAYTGYRLKAAQAVGENRFYDAETAMNEIRAGLQGLISETIADSFSRVMFGFEGSNDIDLEFMHEFKYDLFGSPTAPSDLFIMGAGMDVDNYFVEPTGYIGGLEFDVSFLSTFLSPAAPGTTTTLSLQSGHTNVLGIRDIRGEWIDFDPGPGTDMRYIITHITLRGLRVEHISTEDYLSVVESDITFSMPNLAFQRSLISARDIADYAFIATDEMRNIGSSNVEINGSAYVGYASLNSGSSLTLAGGGVFTSGGQGVNGNGIVNTDNNGDITVSSSTLEFIVNEGASVWANNINVGTNGLDGRVANRGRIDFKGNTYTAASLILAGNDSEATISGRFFGFGTGLQSPGSTTLEAAYSSSIIANSRSNKLDLSGLNQLFLAGQSFISTGGIDVLTGQSMAVRSDQLAYLVPVDFISGDVVSPMGPGNPPSRDPITSNPLVLNSFDHVPEFEIDFDAPLWTIGGVTRTLADYVDSTMTTDIVYGSRPIGVQPVRRPIGDPTSGQSLFYLFLNFTGFTDPTNRQAAAINEANTFFRDYFASDPMNINSYIGVYLDEYRASGNTKQAAGYMYDEYDPAAGRFMLDFDATLAAGGLVAENLSAEYNNRRVYLNRSAILTDPGHWPTNPFEFVIRGRPNVATPSLPTHYDRPPAGYYEFDGNRTAYVYDGTLMLSSISSSDLDTIMIIICYGDVIVDTEFTGLILCRGNLTLQRDVKAGEQFLSSALKGTLEGDSTVRLGDYLTIKIDDDASDDENVNAWALSELVFFSNWRKE